ncbi:CRISPR-associated protein Csx20 [Thermosulfurimonas dismutans]|uniref:Uncharacterized protein n=1 Tax=Thermosulfurimonas dismutans TaxID=999894 RepID=A0A179D1S7_9BACT|nr:CRISPR-associated protein Csx20 [Thermosulfurimonas dismutans]OAQ20024.1 hypothetical protein TDIS_1843 [Thermosulfurimonas dismutans]
MVAGKSGLRKVLLIFSHHLTPDQERELREEWKVGEFVELPPELQKLWAGVPPEAETLEPYLEPLFCWMAGVARPGDLAFIQGEFGAVYLTVRRALKLGLTPIYATSRREVREKYLLDGSVIQERVFKHVRFRIYGR